MKKKRFAVLLYTLPFLVISGSLFIGPSQTINPLAIINSLTTDSVNTKLIKSIILDVRLPRVLLTFLVGGTLAMSGCSIQAIFRNPLTDSYILGLSSGAAFGAALALAYSFIPLQLSSFLFGLLAVGMSYYMARRNKNVSIVSLILAGIIVSGIFTSLLTIVQYFSDPFKLQSIIHWTMGNLHNANWEKVKSSFVPITFGVAVMLLYRWRLNVLAMGDDVAKSVGINPGKDRLIILMAATLASSASVAVAGIIGLYGLLVPHLVRMIGGPDNRQAVIMNFLFGGTFLLIIDDFSRSFSGFEMPVGVLTMLIGSPFFIFLMKKANIGWNN